MFQACQPSMLHHNCKLYSRDIENWKLPSHSFNHSYFIAAVNSVTINFNSINFNLSYKHDSLRRNNKSQFILLPSSIVFLLAFKILIALILWAQTHMCAFRIKYENKSHTYTHTGPWFKLGMEHSSKLYWGRLPTITWVMHSWFPQLPTTSAGNAILNLFTVLWSFIHLNPKPQQMPFPKQCPTPRFWLPTGCTLRESFLFYLWSLNVVMAVKKPKPNSL